MNTTRDPKAGWSFRLTGSSGGIWKTNTFQKGRTQLAKKEAASILNNQDKIAVEHIVTPALSLLKSKTVNRKPELSQIINTDYWRIKSNNNGQGQTLLTKVSTVVGAKLPQINTIKERRERTSMANVSCRISKPEPYTGPNKYKQTTTGKERHGSFPNCPE